MSCEGFFLKSGVALMILARNDTSRARQGQSIIHDLPTAACLQCSCALSCVSVHLDDSAIPAFIKQTLVWLA